jgi:hypothetical protein
MKLKMMVLGLAMQLYGLAQSPDVFRGGSGDGVAKIVYTQPSFGFWLGGDADGFALTRYVQPSAAFWAGGEGDGAVSISYRQPTAAFWLGGEGDGHTKSVYLQPSADFWLGGQGDGHSTQGYAQPSTAFWLGGFGDGWASTYIPNRALPVTFTQFEASKQPNNEALLKWTTKTEANSSHFVIERSADAVNFVSIGEQVAAGSSNTERRYNYLDTRVLNGNNYYRLKQVDRNGQFVYTPTRMVRFDGLYAPRITIYPNPATHVANLQLSPELLGQRLVINMMDAKGNVVKQWKLNQPNQALLQLQLQGLPRGAYLVHISSQYLNNTQKLLIQ